MQPFVPDDRVEVLTHCDPLRAIRACLLARSVPSNIRVICAVNGTLDAIDARMGRTSMPDNLTFVTMRPELVYPANALRNRALADATAEWVCYIDCDFVFCSEFWTKIGIADGRLVGTDDRVCLCPAALWDPEAAYIATAERQDILNTETYDTHRPPRTWCEAGQAKLFKYHHRYFTGALGDGVPYYEITLQMHALRSWFPAEPWGVLKRKHVALADEEFRAGPMDKQQFVTALLDRGLRFFAMPDVFIFHMWHPDSSHGWPDRARNECLFAKRYRGLSHHYLLIGIGGALPARVPALLTKELLSMFSSRVFE